MLETTIEDGKACGHKGCLSHISHPCEGCGRHGGRVQSALDAAIAFARKNDMKVVIVEATGRIFVAYPSGESASIPNDDTAAKQIVDMTCRML